MMPGVMVALTNVFQERMNSEGGMYNPASEVKDGFIKTQNGLLMELVGVLSKEDSGEGDGKVERDKRGVMTDYQMERLVVDPRV